MNYTKSSNVGIDTRINEVQNFIYPLIKTVWGLNDSTLNLFGRVYRNQTSDGYVPEAFDGIEYREVFIEDRAAATLFFGLGETVKSAEGYDTAEPFIICMCDLTRIGKSTGRQDEEAKLDLEHIFKKYLNGFKVISTQTGFDTVFKDYTGWRKKNGLKYRDTHPFYCFRINFEVTYKIN